MTRNADDRRLSAEENVARPATAQAIKELKQGRGLRFDTPDELFGDLGI